VSHALYYGMRHINGVLVYDMLAWRVRVESNPKSATHCLEIHSALFRSAMLLGNMQTELSLIVLFLSDSQDLYYLAPGEGKLKPSDTIQALHELRIGRPQGSLQFPCFVDECSPYASSSALKPGMVDRVSLGDPRVRFHHGNMLYEFLFFASIKLKPFLKGERRIEFQ
jgi:hypothetical protein